MLYGFCWQSLQTPGGPWLCWPPQTPGSLSPAQPCSMCVTLKKSLLSFCKVSAGLASRCQQHPDFLGIASICVLPAQEGSLHPTPAPLPCHTQQQGQDRGDPRESGVLFLLSLDPGLETATLLAASEGYLDTCPASVILACCISQNRPQGHCDLQKVMPVSGCWFLGAAATGHQTLHCGRRRVKAL